MRTQAVRVMPGEEPCSAKTRASLRSPNSDGAGAGPRSAGETMMNVIRGAGERSAGRCAVPMQAQRVWLPYAYVSLHMARSADAPALARTFVTHTEQDDFLARTDNVLIFAR
ncbi:hypothetical protein SFRURICE_020441 [Spodoptera frugiperda]|nr:hypothetical protein SFRURICE_020441 [Spodoptera frugiperda]